MFLKTDWPYMSVSRYAFLQINIPEKRELLICLLGNPILYINHTGQTINQQSHPTY